MIKYSFLFITVSYNNTRSTKEYINSFLSLIENESSLLVVVDNSTEKDKELESYIDNLSLSNIIYLRQDKNLGYMAGCNYGYLNYIEKCVENPIVVYSNNDITFETKNMLPTIREIYSRDNSLAMISPAVLDVNTGKELNPFLTSRPSIKTIKKLKFLYSNYYIAKLVNDISRRKKHTQEYFSEIKDGSDIYATHGCIFIFKLNSLNLPDSNYFLYAEEITMAEIFKNKNLKTKFFSNIKVKHISHSTTGFNFSYSEYKFKKKSINYISEKYKW